MRSNAISCYAFALLLILISASDTAASESLSLQQVGEKAFALLEQDRNREAMEYLLDEAESAEDPERSIALLRMATENWNSESSEPSLLDDALTRISAGPYTFSDSQQLSLDRLRIEAAALHGDYTRAAALATQARTKWERVGERPSYLYEDEVIMIYKAKGVDAALEAVAETMANHSESSQINLIVRAKLAETLFDQGDYERAFGLLHDFRGTFPQETQQQPYLLQNYAEYAFHRFHDVPLETSKGELVDVVEFVREGVESEAFPESLKYILYYDVARLYQKLRFAKDALHYYELASSSIPSDGELEAHIRTMSEFERERIATGDYRAFEVKEYGEDYVSFTFDPPQNPSMESLLDEVRDTPEGEAQKADAKAAPAAKSEEPTDEPISNLAFALIGGIPLLFVAAAVLYRSRTRQ